MDEIPILSRDDFSHIVKEFMSQYDAPAYMRRARRVQQAFDELIGRCRQQREQWSGMTRTRLGLLKAMAGEWTALRPLLADDEQLEILARLEAALAPKLRVQIAPTTSLRKLRAALLELIESVERFNQCWQALLASIDLTEINDLRDGYNRYYLLEKECAFRSTRLARQGFRPLEPLTRAEVVALLPPLPVPRLKG